MNKHDISVLDDEKIKDLFEASFRARLADSGNNDIVIEDDNFECEVEREGQAGDIRVKMTVFGLAGGTTRRQFHDKETGKVIRGGKRITIDIPGKLPARFVLDNSSELNTNDYVLFYKLER